MSLTACCTTTINDSDYRALAVEFVRMVGDLVMHTGSRCAFNLAADLVEGAEIDHAELEAAKAGALADRRICTDEARDGRAHAAEAAWLLLAPNAKEIIHQVADNVSKALAAKIVTERRGALTPATQDEFEYIRAVELELLQDRVAKLDAGR